MKAHKADYRCRACGCRWSTFTTGAKSPSTQPQRCHGSGCDSTNTECTFFGDVELELDARGAPVFLKPGQVSVPVGVERAHVSARIIRKSGEVENLGVVASNDPAHPVEYRNPPKE